MSNRDRPKRKLIHGTLSGYKEYRCRCAKCSEIWELYTNQFREDIYDETKRKAPPVKYFPDERDYSERDERYNRKGYLD